MNSDRWIETFFLVGRALNLKGLKSPRGLFVMIATHTTYVLAWTCLKIFILSHHQLSFLHPNVQLKGIRNFQIQSNNLEIWISLVSLFCFWYLFLQFRNCLLDANKTKTSRPIIFSTMTMLRCHASFLIVSVLLVELTSAWTPAISPCSVSRPSTCLKAVADSSRRDAFFSLAATGMAACVIPTIA